MFPNYQIGDPLFECVLQFVGKMGDTDFKFAYSCDQVGVVTKVGEDDITIKGMGRFNGKIPTISKSVLSPPPVGRKEEISHGMLYCRFIPSKEDGANLAKIALAEIRRRLSLNAAEQKLILDCAMCPVSGLETELSKGTENCDG